MTLRDAVKELPCFFVWGALRRPDPGGVTLACDAVEVDGGPLPEHAWCPACRLRALAASPEPERAEASENEFALRISDYRDAVEENDRLRARVGEGERALAEMTEARDLWKHEQNKSAEAHRATLSRERAVRDAASALAFEFDRRSGMSESMLSRITKRGMLAKCAEDVRAVAATFRAAPSPEPAREPTQETCAECGGSGDIGGIGWKFKACGVCNGTGRVPGRAGMEP